MNVITTSVASIKNIIVNRKTKIARGIATSKKGENTTHHEQLMILSCFRIASSITVGIVR